MILLLECLIAKLGVYVITWVSCEAWKPCILNAMNLDALIYEAPFTKFSPSDWGMNCIHCGLWKSSMSCYVCHDCEVRCEWSTMLHTLWNRFLYGTSFMCKWSLKLWKWWMVFLLFPLRFNWSGAWLRAYSAWKWCSRVDMYENDTYLERPGCMKVTHAQWVLWI